MREAVSLMGGYGITEDCPGFLANKWMDAQLEATYEGPEAVQRRQLTVTMTSDLFLAQFRAWTVAMRRIASDHPGTGACTLASAMKLWLWTLNHLQKATDPDGNKLYHGQRQGVTFALADALCWLLASRAQILDVLELEAQRRLRCSRRRRPRRHRAVPQRPLPHAGRASRRRSFAHLRRAGLRLQPAIPHGTRRTTRTASLQANSKTTKRPCPASPPWPSTSLPPTAAIRSKPAPAPTAWLQRIPPPAKQAHHLPQRRTPGQRPRRRNRQQSHDSPKPWTTRHEQARSSAVSHAVAGSRSRWVGSWPT